jgi:hypothetical protein
MKRILAAIIILAASVAPAWASTWYISTTGSDTNPGTSSGAAFATFAHALAAMSGCDTLIVENGYYYDHIHTLSNLTGNVGSSGCYTTIEAATPFGVTIDASHTTPVPEETIGIFYNYIKFIGIEAAGFPTDTTGNMSYVWLVNSANHVKLQQTAGFNAPCGLTNNGAWNNDVYTIGPGSSYTLVEDSHAWGCGRYKFMAYQSDHVIFRRDVARHDFAAMSDSPLTPMSQCGDFVNYDGQDDIFQNDVGVDSGMVSGETGNMYGCFWSEHNDPGIDNSIIFEGSICDNVQGANTWYDPKQSGTHTFINDAAVNDLGGMNMGPALEPTATVTSVTLGTSYATITVSVPIATYTGNIGAFSGLTGSAAVLNGGFYSVLTGNLSSSTFTVNYSTVSPGGPYTTGGTFTYTDGITLPTTSITHMTVANINGNGGVEPEDGDTSDGVGVVNVIPFTWFQSQTVTNNILEGITSNIGHSSAIADYVTSNYNYYYENLANFGQTDYVSTMPTAGANDVQGVNPQIKYITREEVGSPVYGTASDGGNIGATILYEIGTTGTLWGDTGYDTITSTSLWPFPNEAVIKSDMATFSMVNPITSNTISGTRGFAASGTGLYGGPITLTSYIWESLGNACPGTICTGATSTASSAFGVKFGAGKFQ